MNCPRPIPTYTNQQMLDMARASLFTAMQAQSIGKADRQFTAQDIAKLQAAVDYWQERVDADAGLTGNGGVSYATFG